MLTERILAAENVSASRTDVIKDVLAPVASLGLPVLGVVSVARNPSCWLRRRVFPDVPHQVCQSHFLREASRPMFEALRHLKMQVRKPLQSGLSVLRDQLIKDRQAPRYAGAPEAEAPGPPEWLSARRPDHSDLRGHRAL